MRRANYAREDYGRAIAWMYTFFLLLAGSWSPANGAEFEYSLRGGPISVHPEVIRSSPVTDVNHRVYSNVQTLMEDKYADIEEKWRGAIPITVGDAVSPPISDWPAVGRGPYAERRDYTLNRQPGVPPLNGPRPVTREDFYRELNMTVPSGNFCDEGSVDTRCIVHRELLLPVTAASPAYTLSGKGLTPFARTSFCSCQSLGCSCSVEIGDFLPEFADLSWARLTVEVERGGVELEGDAALIKSIKVDGTLLADQCNPPRHCTHPESHSLSGAAVCDPLCGEWYTCARSRDISSLAVNGRLAVTVESGNWAFLGGTCGASVFVLLYQ